MKIALGLLVFLVAVSVGVIGTWGLKIKSARASDEHIRNQTVLLHSSFGSCTGVQVIAPSKKIYVLTAGHCRDLVQGGKVASQNEDNTEDILDFLAEDSLADLMILTSPKTEGVFVAEDTMNHERVHTITHGKAMPSYRTDGEFLKIKYVNIPFFEITDAESEAKCKQFPAKFQIIELESLFGNMKVCAISTFQMFSTAAIVPGSSGGPIVNSNGDLVGIASCGGGDFYGFVTLNDIKSFLRNY